MLPECIDLVVGALSRSRMRVHLPCSIPESMAPRSSQSIPRSILAVEGVFAVLSIVTGSSERVEAVRWALPLGKGVFLMVLASWATVLIQAIFFFVLVCGLFRSARSVASSREQRPEQRLEQRLEQRQAIVRQLAIVVCSGVLAVVASAGILPLFM